MLSAENELLRMTSPPASHSPDKGVRSRGPSLACESAPSLLAEQKIEAAEDKRLDAERIHVQEGNDVKRFEERNGAGRVFVDQLQTIGLLGGDATEFPGAQPFGLGADKFHRDAHHVEGLRNKICQRVGGKLLNERDAMPAPGAVCGGSMGSGDRLLAAA